MSEQLPLPNTTTPVAAAPNYINRIEFNGKGGLAYDLGLHTLIMGPNSSRKSAVINGVELVLTAVASDIAGRDLVKSAEGLLRMAGPDGTLMAKGTLAHGGEALFSVGEKKGERTPKHIAPPGNIDKFLPLRGLAKALTGEDDAARRFLLATAVGALTVKDVVDKVPEPLRTEFSKHFPSTGELSPSAVVKNLLDAATATKAAKGKARRKATAAAEVANVTAVGLAPEPTDADVVAAEQSVKDAQEVLSRAGGASPEEIERLAQEMNWIATEAGRLAAALGAPTTAPVPFAEALTVARYALSNGLAFCPCCATGIDLMRQGQREQQLGALEGAGHAAAQQRAEREAAQARYNDLKVQYEQRQNLHSYLSARTGGITVEGAKMALTYAEQQLTQMKTIKAQHSAARASKGLEVASEQAAEQHKLLHKTIGKIIVELLDGAVDKFTARVQRYLPDTDHFGLVLHEDGKEVIRFGLWHQEGPLTPENPSQLHTALSGAEWARVLAAVGAAISEDEPLSVLVLPDRSYDPFTLTQVLQSLGNYPGQVLVTSAVPPSEMPAGWDAIVTGDFPTKAGEPARKNPRVIKSTKAANGRVGKA